ncbi:hypothetical protein EVAR_29923_1 [Eumeta japonica]|uniref:Uncharacterized protein n=1 Tax=Eumeta variegata TaxID=151549 RepID=A0A4C1V7S0_EUMVA|nr:hypothetical protein EVAR_29923_1 [Eumeta japonica]
MKPDIKGTRQISRGVLCVLIIKKPGRRGAVAGAEGRRDNLAGIIGFRGCSAHNGCSWPSGAYAVGRVLCTKSLRLDLLPRPHTPASVPVLPRADAVINRRTSVAIFTVKYCGHLLRASAGDASQYDITELFKMQRDVAIFNRSQRHRDRFPRQPITGDPDKVDRENIAANYLNTALTGAPP